MPENHFITKFVDISFKKIYDLKKSILNWLINYNLNK